jgi:hypothetical protein
MNDQQNPEGEKKIYVDEDWKSQVQSEREKLRETGSPGGQQESQPEAASAGHQAQGEPGSEQAPPRGPLPPPSLSLLVTTLATQAMVALGVVPNPLSGKTESDLEQAKHFIDTIQMLQQKTEGNRTAEESQMIDAVLHELRMGFLGAQGQGDSTQPD